MATIDDAQLDALVKAAQLLQSLQTNPNAVAHLERAIKVVHPQVETSEELAARQAKPLIEPMQQRIDELQARFDERVAAEEERTRAAQLAYAEKQIEATFTRLREKDGYTAEGIEKIKELMVQRSIADPDAAAALFDRMNPAPKQEQAAWEPQRWNLQDSAVEGDVKGLFADPDKWADNAVGQVLLEERQRTSAG